MNQHGSTQGPLQSGSWTESAVEKASGIHNLYLVFPGGEVNSVDWFRFVPGDNK